MEIQFAIVRSENREYLCYKAGEAYVDASNPMIAFAAGEDEFEIVEPDSSFRQKEYIFAFGGSWRIRTAVHGFADR